MTQIVTLIKNLFTPFLVLFLLLSVSASSHANADLLKVDQAFQLKAPVIENQQIILEWEVAEDYYLYRDKIKLSSDELNTEQAIYSQAERVDDPLFGKTDVYKHPASIQIPYSQEQANSTVTLSVKYQGCAALLGVCYPPQTHTFTLDLPAIESNAAQAKEEGGLFGSLSALNDLFSSNTSQTELLPVEKFNLATKLIQTVN